MKKLLLMLLSLAMSTSLVAQEPSWKTLRKLRLDPARFTHDKAWNLRLGLPMGISLMNLRSEKVNKQTRSGGSMTGYLIGVNYFDSDRSYFDLSFRTPTNGLMGYIAGDDRLFSVYGALTRNHVMAGKRLSLGYGLSYGYEMIQTHFLSAFSGYEEDVTSKTSSLGLAFPLNYFTRRSFYMGLIYRPMLVQFNAPKTRFTYQHTIALEMGWRLRLAN